MLTMRALNLYKNPKPFVMYDAKCILKRITNAFLSLGYQHFSNAFERHFELIFWYRLDVRHHNAVSIAISNLKFSKFFTGWINFGNSWDEE